MTSPPATAMNILPRITTPDLERKRFARQRMSTRCLVPAPENPDRVITLAPLSSGVAHRLIVDNLARTLRNETVRTVLLVRIVMAREKLSLEDCGQLKAGINGEFGLSDHVRSLGEGVRRLWCASVRARWRPGISCPFWPIASVIFFTSCWS
jgi:hypothetical protein